MKEASKGLRELEGASRGLQGGFTFRKVSRRLERGLKGTSRGLKGGLKPFEGEEGFEGLGLEGNFTFGML